MYAVKVNLRVESDSLHIPQLRLFVGKNVEIIVMETEPQAAVTNQEKASLIGSVGKYEQPYESVAQSEWEAA